MSSHSPTPSAASSVMPVVNGSDSHPVMTLDSLDQECSALGGLFQQVVNDMKNGVPFYEDFVNKANKLHGQLKSTIFALSSFLDTFQKIADAATNTKGATREIGSCLTRIVIRHKSMESRMKTLCSALLDSMVLPLQDKLEEWKKTTSMLDKDHAKEYKKLRADIKKKNENSQRIQKKNKKSKDPKSQKIMETVINDVNKSMKHLKDTEKNAVRRVLMEERSRYCTFVACLKPLMDEEISFVSEFQQLEEVSKKLSRHTEEPFKLPPASEQVINDLAQNSGDSAFTFQTPPSSPSSLGSRKSSMCSISSAGSSTSSSVHHSPSHQSGAQLRHRSLSQAHHNPSSLGPQMMRLSSISSQDSGFTSQDTLFPRPNSPSGRNKGLGPHHEDSNVLTERPHTISSAYEKGHQRPQLQPYTFQPPCESINEHEAETDTIGRKPPVPQRCVSLESQRPMPKGKKPTNAQIQTQLRGSNTALPNFNSSRQDMVLPQPVYMNMSDLAVMAAQKAASQNAQNHTPTEEDSPDLKTPTAEDLNHIPGHKIVATNGDGGSSTGESSLGSSSGYGSQSTVRIEEQQQIHLQQQQQQIHLQQQHLQQQQLHQQQLQLQQQQQQQQQTPNATLQEGHPHFVASMPLLDSQRYHCSQSAFLQNAAHFAPQHSHHNIQHQNHGRILVHRPFSFTHGVIPELNEQGSAMSPHNVATLRRNHSTNSSTLKPPPPQRRPTSNIRDEHSPPPPPAPTSGGSNCSTPRGSMEHLPPPPPHLLHPDEETDPSIVTGRGRSVAESVKALQNSGHLPCSPKTLRRAHSVAGGQSPYQLQQQLQKQPPMVPPKQEQIYAPVAHLQQKIHQRQLQQQSSPEGDKYGFGMQFHHHQSQFYHQMHDSGIPMNSPPDSPQQYGVAAHDQIMRDIDPKLRSRPQPPPLVQQQPRTIPNLGGSPQRQVQGGIYANGGSLAGLSSNYDEQTALRVRRWIDSKSVTDVRDCRPHLNVEIQQGFALRKTTLSNDRSAPQL